MNSAAIVMLLVTTTTPHRDAAAVLDETLVRATSGFSGAFTHERMAPADPSYTDVHLRAIARPEDYDVALRIWTLSVTARRDKLAQLHADLPRVTDTSLIRNHAFFSEDPDIVGVVFQDDCGAIVMLTCGKQQCRNAVAAIDLARRIQTRLDLQCG